ncbi:MAG: hypothetical protein U0Q19_02415 [Kineosporiaceae bacterium]
MPDSTSGHESRATCGSKNVAWIRGQPGELTIATVSSTSRTELLTSAMSADLRVRERP